MFYIIVTLEIEWKYLIEKVDSQKKLQLLILEYVLIFS